MSFIEARGLKRRYPGTLELEADLAIDRGQVTAVIGPSGAGKSTLLRLLALLEKPDEGEVTIDGRPASRRISQRRRISMVLQAPVMWRGSVIDNAAYGLAIRGVRRKEQIVRAEEALALTGYQGDPGREARSLSGGEKQRVSLARALAVNPEALLLDEPLGQIDEASRRALASELRKFTLRSGCATAWVTHQREEAFAVSDSVAVMASGRVLQTGPLDEVFARPLTREVAGVVGTENMLQGEIRSQTDGLAEIEVGPHVLEAVTDAHAGARVTVLVRPEDISVSRDRPTGASPRNTLAARLVDTVTLGATTQMRLDIGGSELTALVMRRTFEDLSISLGSEVWVGFKATGLHVIARS